MMKRIFAILLSIVMSLGMGFSAYALPEEETPIDPLILGPVKLADALEDVLLELL